MKQKTFRFGTFSTKVSFYPYTEILEMKEARRLGVYDAITAALVPEQDRFRGTEARVVLPPGEREKTLRNIEKILDRALSLKMGRDDLFIGIGGGVICDMAALAASLYMRGCPLVLVPTTLLAMVDASVGGKTGVDFRGYKNMIGTFYPAKEIRVSLNFLPSLPEREYRCGLGEIIKHGFLGDNKILEILTSYKDGIEARESSILEEIVWLSILVKGKIVENDFKETGGREVLNFGHTFAHALESTSGFEKYPHGLAVGWGMRTAFLLGRHLGITDAGYQEYALRLLSEYGYPEQVDADPETLATAMEQDKKKRGGDVRFVLQKRQGDTFVTEVAKSEVSRILHMVTY